MRRFIIAYFIPADVSMQWVVVVNSDPRW